MPAVASHAALPREIAPGIFWIGDCIEFNYEGEQLHSSLSVYVVAGADCSLVVDMGLPSHWPVLSAHIAALVADGLPPIRYLFPTHSEVPHAGNVARWAALFPDAVIAGDVRDYHLYFPHLTDRLLDARAGATIDLGGGAIFEVVPAVVRDLPVTVWGYDRQRQVLFPGDGFGYMHLHAAGQCGRTAEEVAVLDYTRMARTINQFALYWTFHTDVQHHIDELHRLLERHPARLICPAHGLPLAEPATTMPKVLDGLRIRDFEAPATDLDTSWI